MRRVLQWTKRIVLGALASALVLVVIALIVVHTDWGRDQIRKRIESSLQGTFAGGAAVREVEGSVLGKLTIRGIELRSIDGKPAITVETLEVELAIWSLLKKHAVVETARADGVRIIVGGAPLTKPSTEPPGEPTAWSVTLPEIRVEHGTLEVLGAQPISIDDLALEGELAIPAGEPLAMNLSATGRWRERALAVKLDGSIVIREGVRIPKGTASVGDAIVRVENLVIDTLQPAGTITIEATPKAIAAIAPEIEIPADEKISLTATLASPDALGTTETQIDITGNLGKDLVNGAIRADATKRTAAGYLGIRVTDLAKLTRQRFGGAGDVALVLSADKLGVRGIASMRGRVTVPNTEPIPAGGATVFLDVAWQGESKVSVLASADGDARVAMTAQGTRTPAAITLARAHVIALVKDLRRASGDRVLAASPSDLRVDVKLDEATPATLWPQLAGSVTGSVGGSTITYYDADRASLASVGRLTGELGATVRTDAAKQLVLTGWARATALRVVRPGQALGDAELRASIDKDRLIRATATARPAAVPVEVVANANITIAGDTIDVRFDRHSVSPRAQPVQQVSATAPAPILVKPWSGTGGRLVIAPDKVTLTGFATGSGTGKAEVKTATFARGTGALDLQLAVTTLPIGAVDPTLSGTASGTLAITRKGTRWDGTGHFDADQLVLGPNAPVVDGKVHVELHGREITVDVAGKSPQIGGGRLELAVQGPADITDFAAWKRLEHKAIHVATITVDKVDLASQVAVGGKIDGKVQIVGATTTAGTLAVRGVETPLGTASGDVTISPLNTDLFASWNANIAGVGEASVGLRIGFPRYVFDPAAWKQLGRGIVKSLTASFEDIAFDPQKLAKLKIIAPYSGRIDVKVAVGAAATAATINADVRALEGGVLTRPIDIRIEATTDGLGTTASTCVARAMDKRGDACASGSLAAGAATVPRLLAIENVTLPVAFSTWVSAPRSALGAPLAGRLTIPTQSAPELAALFGRSDFDPARGTIDGLVTVGGTLGKPTGKGEIVARNLKLISYIAGRDIPELTQLKLSGNWDGATARVDVTANESNNGVLASTITVRPDRLGDAVMSFRATTLDLAPLAAFLPGDLAASTGTMNGKLVVEGLDLATAKMEGLLRIDNAQIPIAPVIGTLRDAHVSLELTSKAITLDARGLLNVCRDPRRPKCKDNVTLKLNAPPDLTSVKGMLVVSKVAPIAEVEPIIDATAMIDLEHKPGARRWTGDITLTNASVRVPPSVGDDLLDADDPEDVFFIEKPPPESSFAKAREVESRWLRANLKFSNVRLEVEEYGAIAYLGADNLKLLVGDHIGLDGKIVIERGTAENVFGRQYQIAQHEVVTFERNLDPIVNLEMSHKFNELTLTMSVQGSPSDKEFPKPRFSSDNSQYSENQLFQIFLGGAPSSGTDSTTQAREAAQNATTSVLSQLVLKRVKNYLPAQLKLDVIKCEPGTTVAGASCTIGVRLLDNKLYIAGKHRLGTVSVNENAEEIELQYYLSSEWYLEGAGGSANIIGTDLLWRRRW